MIASHRRALIRARNNLWLYLMAAAIAGAGLVMVDRLASLGARLARVML
jgi:hypothetical protein